MSQPEDFIEVFPKVFSQEFCDRAIKYFDDMEAAGFTKKRQEHETTATRIFKDDTIVFAIDEEHVALESTQALMTEFLETFFSKCYAEYSDRYSILKHFEQHKIYHAKMQRTEIGGGYHTWHTERMNRDCNNRILVWAVYLNDVTEGGETEFLYQHKRIKAEAGNCMIWPSGFTHVHRGNPPISNPKYIITGWVEF